MDPVTSNIPYFRFGIANILILITITKIIRDVIDKAKGQAMKDRLPERSSCACPARALRSDVCGTAAERLQPQWNPASFRYQHLIFVQPAFRFILRLYFGFSSICSEHDA
jgi:hypothetical protein